MGKDDNRAYTLALKCFFLLSEDHETAWPDLEIEPENEHNGALLAYHPGMQQAIKNVIGDEEYRKLHMPDIQQDYPVLQFMLDMVEPVDHRGQVHKRIENKKMFLNPQRYKEEKAIEDFREEMFPKNFNVLPAKIKSIYEEIN